MNKIKTLSIFEEYGERYNIIILDNGKILSTNSSCIKIYNVKNKFKCNNDRKISFQDVIKVKMVIL